MTQKNLRKLPNDIWEIDIDSAVIIPPTGSTLTELPSFPEPEGKILRYHLKQVNHLLLLYIRVNSLNISRKVIYLDFICYLGIGQYCNSAYKEFRGSFS